MKEMCAVFNLLEDLQKAKGTDEITFLETILAVWIFLNFFNRKDWQKNES